MKTQTTITGLFVLLARPLLDAIRDECSVWRRNCSHGRDDYNSPAAPDRAASLEPVPVATPEPTAIVMPDPVITFSVSTPAEPCPAAIPESSVTISVMVAPVATPEPVFTIPAQAKRETKATKRTRKPAPAKSAARTEEKSVQACPRAKRSQVCSSA